MEVAPPAKCDIFYDESSGLFEPMPATIAARGLVKQLNRVREWSSRLKKVANCGPRPHRHAFLYTCLNVEAQKLCLAALNPKSLHYSKIKLLLNGTDPSDRLMSHRLRKVKELMDEELLGCRSTAKKESKEKNRQRAAADKYCKAACANLRGGFSAPLFFLKRTKEGPHGEPIGTYTTNPKEIDKLARTFNGRFYAGNIEGDPDSHAARFTSKWIKYIFKHDPFDIPIISAQQLYDMSINGPFTAGGLDGWAPIDFSILPCSAFQWPADIMNGIENGMDWPSQLLHGKSSFLCKTAEPSHELGDHRCLLLLPVFYRKWAKVRLSSLAPWIDEWACDELFAGIPGRGAEDAWWTTSLNIEHATMLGLKGTGGAVDLSKCFDRINRSVAKFQLLAAGVPPTIVETYLKFQDKLLVYNSLAGGIGKAYRKPFSIPQGCPLSMCIISIMLRPIVMYIKDTYAAQAFRVIPRVLADDLFLYAQGSGHLKAFTEAFSIMHEFLHDTGSIINPSKSILFSSDEGIRKFLSLHIWPNVKVAIPVVVHFRDLGAYINVSCKNVGVTLSERIRKAIPKIIMIGYMNVSQATKIRLITLAVYSAAFYGCEASYVDESLISKLTTVVASVMGPNSARRCLALVFGMDTTGKEMDPTAVICIRRFTMCRRMCAKNVECCHLASDLIIMYSRAGFPGTVSEDGDSANLPDQAAPPHGHPDRAAWKNALHPIGPIGHLCYSAAQYRMCIDHTMHCHQKLEIPFNILFCPYQFLYKLTRDMIVRARNEHAFKGRTFLKGTRELDFDILHEALSKFTGDDLATLQYHLTLSGWSSELLFNIGRMQDAACKCGFHTQSLIHILWYCPLHKEARDKDSRIAAISDLNIPLALRMGLPPALGSDLRGPVWDEDGYSEDKERCHGCDRFENILQIVYGDKHHKPEKYTSFVDGEAFFHKVVPNDPVLRPLNARQLVANIKGAYHDPTISVPPPIEDGLTGVAEFSGFSDGGLSSPNVPKWGIAGCCMYHPERRLATNPLQDYEKVLCDTNDPNSSPYTMQCTLHPEGKGVILHHFIPGQYCSSTRAEIYPVLLALCCRMTVRLATDSANMLRQLLVLINNPLYKPSKPWNLLPDGDLWQIIQKLIISIGHSTAKRIIEAGKVKAHTDKIPDAIEKGIITLYQQTCNKVADDYAPPSRIGSVMQNESQYAIFCHRRADVYADLLKII